MDIQMSIENEIVELRTAVKELTAALVATAKLAPGKADAKPDAKTVPKATRDEMMAVLKELGESKGADVAKAIIKEVGKSPKMAEIKDAQIDAVYKAAKAKLAEEAAPAPEDGDGL